MLRYQDVSNMYKTDIGTGSTVTIKSVVAGSTTTLQSAAAGFTLQANTQYSIRARASGTQLAVRVWPTSSSEPTTWTVTTSDSRFAAGPCGVRTVINTDVVRYSRFHAATP